MRKQVLSSFILCMIVAGSIGVRVSRGEDASAAGQIAFVANPNGNWDLFVAEEGGSNVCQLTDTPFDEKSPSWSPDRKQIVYSASDGRLRVIEVNTREIKLIPPLKDKGSEIQPAFSPDGKKIVFVVFKSDTVDDSDLALFDLENGKSGIFLLQRSVQFFPAWSSDGRQIAYINVHCSLECGRIIQELWTVQAQQKTAGQVLMTNSQCMQPDWSPDDKSLAFASDQDGYFDIWVYDIVAQDLKQLTKDPHADTDPCWSPDGERIAFTSSRSGAIQIIIMDKDGQNLETFQPFGDRQIECRSPDWR